MNVGDLVMVTFPDSHLDRPKRPKPGLILQIMTHGHLPDSFLVLTGPKQVWVDRDMLQPFPAASMAQSRRAARHLERLVIKAKGGESDDAE